MSWLLLKGGELKSVVMVIDATQITKYCQGPNKNRLFDLNIRNYLGGVKKNRQILATAEDEPQFFFLYNNGISAICEDLNVDEANGHINASRFSIINWAQTVRSLSKLQGGGVPPKVLLQVTEIPNHKERLDLLRNIVRFNNTQNEIKTSDFRSNDVIQASFKQQFSSLSKDGNKCEYFPKRTDKRQKAVPTHKIEMADFAKAIFCYLFNPYELESKGSAILFDAETGIYEKLFGEVEGTINKDEFLVKAGIYFIWETLGQSIKEQRKALKERNDEDAQNIKNAIERKTVLMWMLRHFFSRFQDEHPDDFSEEVFLRKFAKHKHLKSKDDSPVMEFLNESLKKTQEMVVYEYGRLKEGGMTQRQWVRGHNNVKETLESGFKTFPSLIDKVEKYLGKV